MTIPAAEDQLKFINSIQRILDEGAFVATYKFALILALADYAVEHGDDSGHPVSLTTDDIAEKFIEYYWRQVVPYAFECKDTATVLKQGAGSQPVILQGVMDLHSKVNGSLSAARMQVKDWTLLSKKVAKTIAEMPLWRLQVAGNTILPFLYKQHGAGRTIDLHSGVVYNFRKFYDLIRTLVQSAWVRHVRMLNSKLLGESDLTGFLFGAERSGLASIRPVLRDIQRDECFYCSQKIKGGGDIDHFIPWSRYPLDLGHNFVLAHASCNRSKHDFLAAPKHLERWQARNYKHGESLGIEFDERNILHDRLATEKIAFWAYSQAEYAGANLWFGKNDLLPVDGGWRAYFM